MAALKHENNTTLTLNVVQVSGAGQNDKADTGKYKSVSPYNNRIRWAIFIFLRLAGI